MIPILLYAKNSYFMWKHQGVNYTLQLKLTDRIYHDYLSYDKRPNHLLKTDDYYQAFLLSRSGDQAIKDLAYGLKQLVQSQDPYDLLELAASFVQGLPYNKAECQPGAIAICDYPYVTLWRGSGTCLDKVILGIMLLKELDFDAAMLYFRQVPLVKDSWDEHVAIGVNLNSYLAFYSGYVFIETTTYALIGSVTRPINRGLQINDPGNQDYYYNIESAKLLGPYEIYLANKNYSFR